MTIQMKGGDLLFQVSDDGWLSVIDSRTKNEVSFGTQEGLRFQALMRAIEESQNITEAKEKANK